MKRTKSSGRETRSKSRARKRSPSPDTDAENQTIDKGTSERPSSRMSRRDSYEHTLIQKSAEKSKSGRSMSRAKSKKRTEKEEDHEVDSRVDAVECHDKKEESEGKEEVSNEVMPRRKSSRKKTDVPNENTVDNPKSQDAERTAAKETNNLEDNTEKDDPPKEDNTAKKLASRRKSKRVLEKEETLVSNEKEPTESEATVHLPEHNEKENKNKRSRKSKRLAVEENDMETDEVLSDDHLPSNQVNSNINDQSEQVMQSESKNETNELSGTEKSKESIAVEDKRSKRKSRRATKALFTAEDIDAIIEDKKPPPSESGEGEKIVEKADNSKQTNDIKKAEKERRGTFVVDKQPTVVVHVDKEIEKIVQKDKGNDKNRRGTFVVPAAPPPAPRPKKTISNIPILEGRAKPTEQKDVKKNWNKTGGEHTS